MQAAQASVQRGQAALWTVTAWATGGNVADATIRLSAAPASLKPAFSFGCGSSDGTASCDLGALDASSAQRQLQAKVTVPASATTVTSVRLTAAGSATDLSKDPQASVTTTVTAVPASSAASAGATGAAGAAGSPLPVTSTSPLSVGNLPDLPSASPALSPGGNAAALFPSLTPSGDTQAKTGPQKASTRTVANSSTLPLGAPVIGAQLAGLGVLALAFVLAVARLSIRRRPAAAQSGPGSTAPPAPGTGPSEPAGSEKPEKPATGPAAPDSASAQQDPASDDDAPEA